MEFFEFASVTYCTNVPRGTSPSDEEAAFVANQVFEIFQTKLNSSPYSSEISVGRIEYGIGCILTTISLTATVDALYKFVKDYPKFRLGLLFLLKDLNGIYLKLKGIEAKGSTYLMRDDIPELKELEQIAAYSASGKKNSTKKTTGVKRRSNKLDECNLWLKNASSGTLQQLNVRYQDADMTIHELDLLENALDSLAEALSKFEEGEDGEQKAYKFAVLHLAHFIELIFKHHIASKHQLLIYKDPFSQKLDRNKTIGLWECINFINNEDPETVSPELRKDLEWIKKLRNEIEHHKFTMDVPQVRSTIGRLFRSVMEFLDDHTELDIESHIPAHTKEAFKVLSDEYEFSIRTAIKAADEVEEANPIDYFDPDADPVRLDCPECSHFTLVVDEDSGTGYRCTFCENEESDELPGTCDICGVHTTQEELDYWPLDDGGVEARCYYCSGRYHADKDD